jgi:predicted nucleotide-binding protein
MAKTIKKAAKKASKPKVEIQKESNGRTRVSQSDMPLYSLQKALCVPQALVEQYGARSATPLQVAKALNVSPTSSSFRYLIGASTAYGLTTGSYNSEKIVLEEIGKKIFKETAEGDSPRAKLTAFLKPKTIRAFFEKYSGSAIPREDIAKNIIEELGVPEERVNSSFEMMLSDGRYVGIVSEHKGKMYVELNANNLTKNEKVDNDPEDDFIDEEVEENINPIKNGDGKNHVEAKTENDIERLKRVFITHGKNTKFIEPIKKLLSFGELLPVVSVEKTSISQPVPDKVMNDMRLCGAAIIHVEDEHKLIDSNATEHSIINSNVLIEIGAAMALYGRRFILLVKNGVTLPSNLQGLFEVRYEGETLDGNATIRLLEAINDIKNQKLPL